jgi:hypothetical protein
MLPLAEGAELCLSSGGTAGVVSQDRRMHPRSYDIGLLGIRDWG